MTQPTSAATPTLPAPDAPGPDAAAPHAPDGDAPVRCRQFRAMATTVTLQVVDPDPGADRQLDQAEAVFRRVEEVCSRFDPAADLARANLDPGRWHRVPALLAHAVLEAYHAHLRTGGLFDPRVLDTLVSWGYDRTLPFDGRGAAPGPDLPATAPSLVPPLTGGPAGGGGLVPPRGWEPQVDRRDDGWHLHLDGQPIDLGGIGKGLAVRWAAQRLTGAGRGVLVDAGGDCALAGSGPTWGPWRVGMEDPAGGAQPLLVLEVSDAAVATSSVSRRHWRVGGVPVHHLVDPRTRRPGGGGLAAVSVLGTDPAWAEVWTKALFLLGPDGIAARAAADDVAAAWVTGDGAIGTSPAMDAFVIWRADA